jgi:transketolase C-terminal domain/subunit
VLCESDIPVKFKRLGIPDKFAPIGLHEDIMSILGIDSNGIINAVFDSLGIRRDDDDNWDDEV